ncbi:MAG: hypothetical protein WCN98_14490 [Verrucomicrobiaceae bacterium]
MTNWPIHGRIDGAIVMIGFAAGLAPVILKTLEGLAGTRAVLQDVGPEFALEAVTRLYFQAQQRHQ